MKAIEINYYEKPNNCFEFIYTLGVASPASAAVLELVWEQDDLTEFFVLKLYQFI